MPSIYDNFDDKEVEKIRKQVEENSELIDDVVNTILEPYTKDLDEYVAQIDSVLTSKHAPITDEELDEACLNLATCIYSASAMCEKLGIRDDISRALYKETYNRKRQEQDKGTVDDKNTKAELASRQEQLVNICYSRAYKSCKAKVENAQELLQACKKVLSRRLAEAELTRFGVR